MKVWAISDLHLSFARPERRERYAARWRDHAEKIERNWREVVGPGDLVLLPGAPRQPERLQPVPRIRAHGVADQRVGHVRTDDATQVRRELGDAFAELVAIVDERERRRFLCNCPGVGLKTASWLLHNLGLASELAILDVHLLRAMRAAGRVSTTRCATSSRRCCSPRTAPG